MCVYLVLIVLLLAPDCVAGTHITGAGGSRGDLVLETMEYSMAMLKLYEGAVYMHQGHTYVVARFDTDRKECRVQRNDVSYYTEPRDHAKVVILGRSGAREAATPFQLLILPRPGPLQSQSTVAGGVVPQAAAAVKVVGSSQAGTTTGSPAVKREDKSGARLSSVESSGGDQQQARARGPTECVIVVHGRVRVTKTLYGYRKKRASDSQLLDMVDVHGMPPLSYDTFAVWVTIPTVIRDEFHAAGWPMERGAIHTVEHLLISLCPLLVHTEPHDLKCQCTRRSGDGAAEYLLLFEHNRGGIGLAPRIAAQMEKLLTAALRRVNGCLCVNGCARCIFLPNCGDYNEGLTKPAATYLLCRLLGLPCNALPPPPASLAGAAGTAETALGDAAAQSRPASTRWDAGVVLHSSESESEAEELDGDVNERPRRVKVERRTAGERALQPAEGGGGLSRCVLCMQRYDKPVTTQCQHVFCVTCIRSHIANSASASSASPAPAAMTGGSATLSGRSNEFLDLHDDPASAEQQRQSHQQAKRSRRQRQKAEAEAAAQLEGRTARCPACRVRITGACGYNRPCAHQIGR